MIIASCICLWLAALQNQDSEVGVWKGSLLPVLFFPMADGVRGKFGVKSTVREMQLYAENVRGGFG